MTEKSRLDAALERIHMAAAEELGGVMDVRNMYIALYDKQTGKIEFPLRYENGNQIDPKPYVEPRFFGDRYGLTDWIIDNKQPLLISKDFAAEASRLNIEVYSDVPTKSWVGAPMLRGVEVIGVIGLNNFETEGAYDEFHRDLLATIAGQAAVAIDNARLYERLENANAELSIANLELERRNAELIKAREREKLALLGEIAAGLIHKMSNTIGPIPTLTERIARSLDVQDEAARTKLRRIKQGAQDALDYTSGMDKILKLEAVSLEEADLRTLLDDALRQVLQDETHERHRIKITTSYAAEQVTLSANSPLLIEAIRNIIQNAVEAMTEGGTLIVTLDKVDQSKAQIKITDDGCGIPEEKQTEIFRPGYSNKKGGRGIGLWFSKTVVLQHSGEIRFESEQNVGTTFELIFPLKRLVPSWGAKDQEVLYA